MSLSSEFGDALALASRLHRKQRRKGSETPYVAHLLAVTAIALEHGATESEAIAALLHDAVEDQGGQKRLRKIQDQFGKRVARIVAGCSDTTEKPKPPWPERKAAFVERLREAPYSVRLVVAADKLHNVRDVSAGYQAHGVEFWSQFNGGREGTLWYYRAVVDALWSAAQAEEDRLILLVAELDQAVGALEDLADGQGENSISNRPEMLDGEPLGT
jgi:(p)ppGpp synthase/HD superfamily hydrolase